MLSLRLVSRVPVANFRLIQSVNFSTPAPPPPPKTPAQLAAEKAAEIADDELTWKVMKQLQAARKMTITSPLVTNVPDYNVRSSMPADVGEIAALDTAHHTQNDRTVLIRNRPKSAMTSATNKTKFWEIIWQNEERWSNPLMGWSSTADPMANMMNQLRFDTKEQAINFCNKRTWKYEVLPERKTNKKYGGQGYDENFLPKIVKKILKSEKMQTTYFARDNAGTSNYFRPLKYHGDGVVPQHGTTPDTPIEKDVPGYYKQR